MTEINYDHVICPQCCHSFRAIPENVQMELRAGEAAAKERDELRAEVARTDDKIGAIEIHGNSAEHWYAKATAYKDAFTIRDKALEKLTTAEKQRDAALERLRMLAHSACLEWQSYQGKVSVSTKSWDALGEELLRTREFLKAKQPQPEAPGHSGFVGAVERLAKEKAPAEAPKPPPADEPALEALQRAYATDGGTHDPLVWKVARAILELARRPR